MKQYKLCKSCIHYQLLSLISRTPWILMRDPINEEPVCTKSLTPTIKNHQEHCPQYATNSNLRKTKRK